MKENNKNNIVSSEIKIPTRNIKQRLLALSIIAALLVVGVVSFKYLLATKPKAKRRPPAKMQALVKVIRLKATVEPVIVKAFGTVKPAKEISLQARVPGTVDKVHPNLVPGGIVRKGEALVQLDDTDYLLALKQKKDTLAQVKADLRIEEGNQNVARQEWKLITSLTDDVDSSTEDLALRKPQLSKAQVKIQTAQTDIERAELDLSRTTIKSPFDAIIRYKYIDAGSQITTQSKIATLVGVDTFWVEITVPTRELQWIVMPGARRRGSKISAFSGETRFKGKILKLLPALEKDGLMARLLIEINDPMALKRRGSPLLINSFVRVEIIGREIDDVYKMPRAALRDRQNVYVVAGDGTLHIQPVKVAWEDAEFVYIKEGVTNKTSLIVSQLPAPIEAMPLKIEDQEE